MKRTHTHTRLKCSRRHLQVFLCRQGGRKAVRWKPSVTDEKSPPSLLSFSFPLYLPHLALSSILFLCSFLHLAFSLLLLLYLPLIQSLLCASLCLIFFTSLSLFGLYFFSSSLLYSERGNWNSFLQSICCHTNACTNTMLCSSFCFSPISSPCTHQNYNTHPLSLCTTLTHVQSASCVTPKALWV